MLVTAEVVRRGTGEATVPAALDGDVVYVGRLPWLGEYPPLRPDPNLCAPYLGMNEELSS